jgi:hypothetical protein
MATAGVEPRVMGIGPAPATRKVLALAGLTLEQIDVIELNEAFAAQGLAVLRMLGMADDDSRSIRMAGPSPWGTRSAHPVRGLRRLPSTSCTSAAAATPSARCASALARESQSSSSASDQLLGRYRRRQAPTADMTLQRSPRNG